MLTTLLVRIKTMEKRCVTSGAAPDLETDLHALLDLVSETIEQVRELSYRLRPAALEELGLPVALRILVREMTADSDLSAHYETNVDETSLPHGLTVTLYRIAQEGLTNVLRHAGAEQVVVKLLQQDDCIIMDICDDGRGFIPFEITAAPEPGRRHLGLISMQERAAMAGGVLQVDSRLGEGTTLHVRIPLQEKVMA
jgi:signal transduction histidine kinase